MKYLFGLMLSVLIFNASFSQNDTLSIDYNLSYFGNNIWNPGIKFGTEYIWKQQIKQKQNNRKKKKKRVKTQDMIFSGDVGMYWDPMSHTAFFLYGGIKYRNTATKGFQWNASINPVGYYRSFLPETYEVDDDGNIEKVFMPGRSYYSPSITLGIGKLRKNKKLKAWFLDFNFMLLYKYNADILPLINVVYGYRFNWK